MGSKLVTFNMLGMGSLFGEVPIYGDIDPMGVTNFFRGTYGDPQVFRQGFIQTYNPQTHSASVIVSGMNSNSIWTCVFADEMLSYSFGYSETNPPREGEFVLVVSIAPYANAGIVIGRIPYPLRFKGGKGDLYNDPDKYHRRLFTQLKDTEDREITCFKEPFSNKNDNSTHIATHFRPTDVYPGEFARVNQHNCGIKGGMFSATLLGGGASVRLSALKNAARITCEEYIRNTMHGSLHEFHNGRFLSSERNYAMFQEERLGGDAPDAKVWTDDSEEPAGGENQTMRPRMKDLTGFFGHLSSKFCFRPDPSEGSEPRVQGESAPIEAGVSRETIDPSGQYRLSAAGMIAIERTGRIPVPVRNCYPTDKDHDIEEMPESLKPFEHSEEDPSYRQLELFDRQAYDLKNQYARAEGLGQDHSDYDVPEEEQLEPLKDKYDEKFTNSETVKLEKFDKRRAGVFIGEDGSVIVRDAWGSEIVMLGGNIQLSCAGNVMLLPGKTQLTIAGDDIVQKAQNSVDIHASEHDVRLSAARNMEILGGGDESNYSGGVVIESRGYGVYPWDGKDKGEQAGVSGITLRTNNQAVVVDAQEVNIRSKSNTRIVSGDESIDGQVDMAARTIRGRGKNIFMTSGGAAMTVVNDSFMALGESVGVYGSSNLRLTQGSKSRVPFKMEDIGKNIAAEYLPKLNEATEYLADESKASGAYNRETLDKMIFGFRTSSECGTDKPWTIGGPDKFRLYEPAWVQVKEKFDTLKSGGVKSKKYEEKADWENGKPFPGKEAEDSAEYAQLDGMSPKNLTDDGFNAGRDEVKEKSEISTVPLKDGYQVRD